MNPKVIYLIPPSLVLSVIIVNSILSIHFSQSEPEVDNPVNGLTPNKWLFILGIVSLSFWSFSFLLFLLVMYLYFKDRDDCAKFISGSYICCFIIPYIGYTLFMLITGIMILAENYDDLSETLQGFMIYRLIM